MLNIEDPIFDKLKNDYSDFEVWFSKVQLEKFRFYTKSILKV